MVSIHGPLGYEPNTRTTAPLRCLIDCALTRAPKQQHVAICGFGYDGGSGSAMGVHACAQIALKVNAYFKIDLHAWGRGKSGWCPDVTSIHGCGDTQGFNSPSPAHECIPSKRWPKQNTVETMNT